MYLIKQSFDVRFTEKIRELEEKYGAEMIRLEGIGPDKLDINQFAKDFFKTNVLANISSDANANVDDQSIVSFEFEFGKALQKINSYYLLWKKIMEDPNLGIKRANKILELCINGSLKIHDFHRFMVPYCYAFSLETLVTKGLPYISKIKIGPPKHFKSFINLVVQFVSYAANQIAGAAAFPDLFLYMDWYARKDFGENYHDKPEVMAIIREELQSLVFSFNYPYRSSQSAFENVNLYDKYFLKDLFENKIYPDITKPNLESIDKLQKYYMKWFVNESKTQTFTFPINTATFYKNDKNEIEDKDFLDFVSDLNKDNGTFNIFTGPLGVLSSCCFSGEEVIVIKNKNTGIDNIIKLKDFVNNITNNKYDEIKIDSMGYSILSVDPNTGIDKETDIVGVLKRKNNTSTLINITANNKTISVTHDHVFSVKNKITGMIETITAEKLLKSSNMYMLPVI